MGIICIADTSLGWLASPVCHHVSNPLSYVSCTTCTPFSKFRVLAISFEFLVWVDRTCHELMLVKSCVIEFPPFFRHCNVTWICSRGGLSFPWLLGSVLFSSVPIVDFWNFEQLCLVPLWFSGEPTDCMLVLWCSGISSYLSHHPLVYTLYMSYCLEEFDNKSWSFFVMDAWYIV